MYLTLTLNMNLTFIQGEYLGQTSGTMQINWNMISITIWFQRRMQNKREMHIHTL